MNKTQQRLVERAEKALAHGRLKTPFMGDKKLVEDLIALVKRLSEERDEYLERWLRA